MKSGRKLTKAQIRAFQKRVYDHYRREGRDFPWRRTHNPYRILVSEVMLQQTQAGPRTVEKYKAFIKEFPNQDSLAKASLKDVLIFWQGLGYNRRAKALQETVQIIAKEHNGKVPKRESELVKLPGIGPYTAGAVVVFAFNQPIVLLETNIRTTFIYHFFRKQTKISDTILIPFITATLDHKNPRVWYSALMDYGSMLKKTVGNVGQHSKHYIKQTAFAGSNREIRGKIVRALVGHTTLSWQALVHVVQNDKERIATQLFRLVDEGLVKKQKQMFTLG